MPRSTFLLFLLLGWIGLTLAAKPKNIQIDGNFGDWHSVQKYPDPFVSAEDPEPVDGFPAAPDVHNTDQSADLCEIRPRIANPTVDIVEVALAHSETHVFAYFKAVGAIGLTTTSSPDAVPPTSAGRAYLQVLFDVDNNQTTGYCTSLGGYYPNGCGSDMALEIEMYNGTFNTGHVILHSANESDPSLPSIDEVFAQQQHGVVQPDGPASYHPYTQWVYYHSRPSDDEFLRCQAGLLTRGPFELPDGAWICFVSDKCNGPYQGAFRFAFSESGTELEFSMPFTAFMHDVDGRPTMALGRTMLVGFSLETSQQYSTPVDWCSDATTYFAYHFGSDDDRWSASQLALVIILPIVTLALGAVLHPLVAWIHSRFDRRGDFQQISERTDDSLALSALFSSK